MPEETAAEPETAAGTAAADGGPVVEVHAQPATAGASARPEDKD